MKPEQIILTSIIASCLSFPVQAAIIDFQDLEQNSSDSLPQGYKVNGFQVRVIAGSLRISRPQDSSYTGSTALYNSSEGGQTELSKIDGSSFDLFSFDLEERTVESSSNSFASKDITFTRDGGHSQTFSIDGIFPGVETFLFDSGFLGTTSVDWRQNRYVYQFDNIQIDIANNNVPSVPAPPVLWLLVSGLVGLIGMRKK